MSVSKRWFAFCCGWLLLIGLVGCHRPAPPTVPRSTNLGVGAPVAQSPDGGWLLVVKAQADFNEGWLQQVDGTNSRKVLEFTSASFYAAYSPDGKYLAWSTDKLWLARSDGTNPTVILDQADIGPLAWSPDSSQLAVVVGSSIVRVNRSGQQLGEVAQAESIRALNWAQLTSGERLFFISFPADKPAYIANVQPSGQGLTQLADAEAFDLAGERIFIANPLSAGALRVANAIDGSNAVEVVASGVQSAVARRPGWQQVAYIKLSPDGTSSDIWLVGLDGKNPTQLTSGAPVLGPLWSPDGRQLYYASFNLNATEDQDPFQVQKIIVP